MRDIHSLAPGLIPGAGVHGREDNHVQACAGRAYGSIEDALEALTMEMQESFDPVWQKEYSDTMLRDDPEMPDVLPGLRFGYGP